MTRRIATGAPSSVAVQRGCQLSRTTKVVGAPSSTSTSARIHELPRSISEVRPCGSGPVPPEPRCASTSFFIGISEWSQCTVALRSSVRPSGSVPITRTGLTSPGAGSWCTS